MTIQLKRNDTKDTISYTMTYADGTPVNLTGATVRFFMGNGKSLISDGEALIKSANDGQVEYTLTDADTLIAGTFKAEFQVTFSDGKVKTFPTNGYIMVNIQPNMDVNQSTYIEDQIANRVSDLQVWKGEIQSQLDQFAKGDSAPEVAQARVEKDGTTNTTLKARLDKKEAEFSAGIQKVMSDLAQIVTVIKPTGTANDSPNINTILSVGNGKFLIKKGTYNIDEDIIVKSNSIIEWEEGAVFKKVPTSAERYNILFLQDVKNVTLINPQIVGDKYTHTGTTGEWGNGIVLRGTENVKIQNPVVKECWGDGIILSIIYNSTEDYKRYCKNTWISDALCDDNRRNGLTIGSVKGLFVKDSQFNNTKGTDPQAGIDIEPDGTAFYLDDIYFDNILLKNNGKRGIFFCLWLFYGDQDTSPLKTVSITCNNIKVEGGLYGFETLLSNFTDSTDPGTQRTAIKNLSGEIILNNCESKNTAQNGLRLYRWYDAGLKMTFNDLKIDNPNTEKGTGTSHNAIALYEPSGSSTPPEYHLGNVEFNNLEVIHASDDPLKRSIFTNDPTNLNRPTNFSLRNPKKLDGKITFSQGLDNETGLIVDGNKALKLYITDAQRPIDKYEPYYSIVSNKNTTANKTLFINAPTMHYEEITFVCENSFTFTIECDGSQRFFPYNTKQCVLNGYGSKVTVRRIDDLKWEVLNHVNATFV